MLIKTDSILGTYVHAHAHADAHANVLLLVTLLYNIVKRK